MRNDPNKPMHDPDYPDSPLAPGHVRLYEFLHGFEDITFEEENRRKTEWANDPLAQILEEEIRKEIDAEIFRTICFNSTK